MRKPDYLLPDQVGSLLGITGCRVRQMLRAGELPGNNYGNHVWLIDRADVTALLQSGWRRYGRKNGRKLR